MNFIAVLLMMIQLTVSTAAVLLFKIQNLLPNLKTCF
jgi:hypothetical protein